MPRKKVQGQESTITPKLDALNTELLNKLMHLIKNHTAPSQKRKKRRAREPRVGFNLLIPHKLYMQLKNYTDLYADKGESMTEIILTGLEKELKERYAKKLLTEETSTFHRDRTE